MKKILIFILALLFINSIYSQEDAPPEKFKFQAIIKNDKDRVVKNQTIGVEVSIYQTSLNGTLVYREGFNPTADSSGMINLDIGTGTPTTGEFSEIQWGDGSYFMEVGVDPSGGTNYISMGGSQLLSVPYALYAKTANHIEGVDLEYQTISLKDNILTLTNGGSVELPTSANFSFFYADRDGDGFGDKWNVVNVNQTPPVGYVENGNDCNDADSTIYPGAVEIPEDGIDQDCSGEDTYNDNDSDGFTSDVDCNDNDATIYPGAPEVINDRIDQDCDGEDTITDADGDGVNDAIDNCPDIPGDNINYGCPYPEVYDFSPKVISLKDLQNSQVTLSFTGNNFYDPCCDVDRGGYMLRNESNFVINIYKWDPVGQQVEFFESLTPIFVNEGLYNANFSYFAPEPDYYYTASTAGTYHIEFKIGDGSYFSHIFFEGLEIINDLDEDGDTYSVSDGDCDDTDPTIYPGATEICGDGIDQDCDGLFDDVCSDADGDGFTVSDGDCDDTDPTIYPGATEICGDGIDNNCNGETDEGCNQVIDIDGNIYNTITIGTQTWMVENLKTTKYNDGVVIPYVTDSGEWSNLTSPGYCWYDNDKDTYQNDYGALYNWYAVETQKLSPDGWHIPTEEEWQILENYLIANGYNYDGTTSGDKIALSLASEENWSYYGGLQGTPGSPSYPEYRNKSGFTGQPSGFRDFVNGYGYLASMTYWWSSSMISNLGYAVAALIWVGGPDLDIGSDPKKNGFSVRCIKD